MTAPGRRRPGCEPRAAHRASLALPSARPDPFNPSQAAAAGPGNPPIDVPLETKRRRVPDVLATISGGKSPPGCYRGQPVAFQGASMQYCALPRRRSLTRRVLPTSAIGARLRDRAGPGHQRDVRQLLQQRGRGGAGARRDLLPQSGHERGRRTTD